MRMFVCTPVRGPAGRAIGTSVVCARTIDWYIRCVTEGVCQPQLESTMTNPNREESTLPEDPAEIPPTELNKPIGDAIPTPVEPGLDQPLPEKPKTDDANTASQ
jgi:hypothetical protein